MGTNSYLLLSACQVYHHLLFFFTSQSPFAFLPVTHPPLLQKHVIRIHRDALEVASGSPELSTSAFKYYVALCLLIRPSHMHLMGTSTACLTY